MLRDSAKPDRAGKTKARQTAKRGRVGVREVEQNRKER